MAKKLMCTKKFYYFFSKFLTTPNSFFTLEKLRKKIGKEKNLEYYRIETFPKQKKRKPMKSIWKKLKSYQAN